MSQNYLTKSDKTPQSLSIVAEDVNRMFTSLVRRINDENIYYTDEESRNGAVMRLGFGPSVLTYLKPMQRVLFNTQRDANPFFHVFESLWMLAGRNDLAPLQYYVSSFDKYSDDGITLNGAYGYRWRHVEQENDGAVNEQDIDQLSILIDHLKKDPHSRRAVLQMWNVQNDLLKIDTSLDNCCNLSAVFDIVANTKLNMTVFNRSNDLIWGALGANVVHFSFLQEYMAHAIGVQVGTYSQVSNNLHIYRDVWDKNGHKYINRSTMHDFSYSDVKIQIPLVEDIQRFDIEVKRFISNPEIDCKEPFLAEVAQPMCLAFRHHKEREYDKALEAVRYIRSDDWRYAATNWIYKRKKNWTAK